MPVNRRAAVGLGGSLLLSGARLLAAQPVNQLPYLRGVNFTGLTHEAGSQAPAAPAPDYYIRRKRMNLVRMNFTWEFIQPRLGEALNALNSGLIQDQINRITAVGAYVILELQNFGRRSVGGANVVIGETATVGAEHFADVWRRMAERWGSDSRIIFGLMNEPHDQDTRVLVNTTNAAIDAIRRTGAANLIMVSGNDWNSMGWRPGSDNLELMLGIRDESDNYCFDVHHYFDHWSQGQGPNVRPDPIASMNAFTQWAKKHRQRGLCGEFGCAMNRRGMEACRELLVHLESNRDVYLGWAWWGAGGPWQPDYVYLLDPYASATSPANPDSAGAQTWNDPVDRPQMKLLQRHLSKDATPFNGWLIEDRTGPSLLSLHRRGDLRLSDKPLRSPGGSSLDAVWVDSSTRASNLAVRIQAGSLRSDGGLAVADGRWLAGGQAADRAIVEAMWAVCRFEWPDATSTSFSGADDGSVKVASEMASGVSTLSGGHREADGSLLLKINRPIVLRLTRSADAQAPGLWDALGRLLASSERVHGVVYDIVCFSSAPSNDIAMRVEGRLYWDAGIAQLLPSNHPYRRRAPALD